MRKSGLVSESELIHRSLLWDTFKKYIDTLYFSGAIKELDGGLISFEFENFNSFYLN
jgi:hypothetical protein